MPFRLMSTIEAVCDTCEIDVEEIVDTLADGKGSLRKQGWIIGTGPSERHDPKREPAKCWCSRECWKKR